MKDRYADLHVHTYYSDSTLSPRQVVETALKVGLSAIGITDHDCVAGIKESIDAAWGQPLEIIPGIELSVDHKGQEVHMLGYFIDWQADWFRKKISVVAESRHQRIFKMIELLKKEKINIEADEVFKLAGKGTVGRLHLALALLKKRKIYSIQEAFDRYIGHGKPCYVGHVMFNAREAIENIVKAGGVPVLAHPHVMGKDSFIDDFLELGLKGIEVYHSDHNESIQRKYRRIARKKGLLVTGGSDCHGLGKGRILMGDVMVKYDVVESLKMKSKGYRA